MNRRLFLKGLSLAAIYAMFPTQLFSDVSEVIFDKATYDKNGAQTIMIFLYGGASELAGNLTNFEEIQQKSQNKYHEPSVTVTQNHFWEQAGGDSLENMLSNGDLNLFRTCYRKSNDSKSHGDCTAENQRGFLNVEEPTYAPGIFANLGKVLFDNGVITKDSKLPFMTMEGESGFFYKGDLDTDHAITPSGIDETLSNPYERDIPSQLYSQEELDSDSQESESAFSKKLDALAKSINQNDILQNSFDKRAVLEEFINEQKQIVLPEGIVYPTHTFGQKLKTAINLLLSNKETKIISLGSSGLGGWDDHSNALQAYSNRMNALMEAIEVAMQHLNSVENTNINIMVFGEFGRNVNLNDSLGWDHGNNQNFYLFGGKNYFNNLGIVGQTQLKPTEENNRLYTEPTPDSYTFEPYSIAATIYAIYGIKNPELLTNGFQSIQEGLLKE